MYRSRVNIQDTMNSAKYNAPFTSITKCQVYNVEVIYIFIYIHFGTMYNAIKMKHENNEHNIHPAVTYKRTKTK